MPRKKVDIKTIEKEGEFIEKAIGDLTEDKEFSFYAQTYEGFTIPLLQQKMPPILGIHPRDPRLKKIPKKAYDVLEKGVMLGIFKRVNVAGTKKVAYVLSDDAPLAEWDLKELDFVYTYVYLLNSMWKGVKKKLELSLRIQDLEKRMIQSEQRLKKLGNENARLALEMRRKGLEEWVNERLAKKI